MAAGKLISPDRLSRKKLAHAIRFKEREKAMAADRCARSATVIRQARTTPTFVAPAENTPQIGASATGIRLETPQYCYVCKVSYHDVHFFYDAMCPSCGDFNYRKRFQTANLTGRVALVTGARIKIGYQTSLLLLRSGARVIATTRFPYDAALRYRQEKDFSTWGDRLQVYGLDLRHAPSVEVFARMISEQYDRLDFLINNAAQTVRRPRGFYAHLVAGETTLPSDPDVQRLLNQFEHCRRRIEDPQLLAPEERGLIAYATDAGRHIAPGLYASADMSQIPVLPEDLTAGSHLFPRDQYDADGQQIDLRSTNSWRMRLGDVSTSEMLELQLINAVAPFILCSKLKPLMLRHPTLDKHIINVSAMEGKFTRYTKTDKHPHTNMAKAALNMMTQTAAPDYARDGIYMNAVDTGWVTDEDPITHATRKREELDFQPPLDIVDGAARVVDPIMVGFNTGEHAWGKFFKDYMPTTW